MDAYFNSYKIKFSIIEKYLLPLKRSYPIKKVNVFINLDDVFHRLHKPYENDVILSSGAGIDKSMIANVLNLCAHYRQAFVRQGWITSVYAFYTSIYNGEFRNELYIKNYRKHYFDISAPSNEDFYAINSCIHTSLELMNVITQYIDGVYLIDSRQIEPSVMPYYITENIRPSDWNFIITRDMYDFQYISYPKWSIFYAHPLQYSYINSDSIWNSVIDLENMDPPPIIKNFPPEFYQISLYVIGDKYRNIPKIRRVGWKSMFGLLQQLQEQTIGLTPAEADAFMIPILGGKDTAIKFHSNIAAVNVKYQSQLISEIDKATFLSSFIDIDDRQNLSNLTRIYFKDYPINLGFLLNNVKEFDPNKPKVNQFGMIINR